MTYRSFNFAGQRIGDKVVAAYLLQYYQFRDKFEYLLFDTSADSYFPIRHFFPDIGKNVIESTDPNELHNFLIPKGFEPMHFGNLWITAPSVKQDSGFLPKMVLPKSLRDFQKSLTSDLENRPLFDYKIRISNHLLKDAGYNCGRNHNQEQWTKLIRRVFNYIRENKIDAVIIDIPTDYSWSVQNIMALVEFTDLYIGGDTGFTHAFAAFNPKKPIVAIYGPNDHDIRAFEDERVRMECSHSWCSDPISDNYAKFYMKDNLFDEDKAFEEAIKQINLLNN